MQPSDIISHAISHLRTLPPPSIQPLVNTQNSAGNTPLHWACLNGHLPVVKLLLEAGADPTIKNEAGHDAAYEAEVAGKVEVVKSVLEEGKGLEEGVGGGEADGEDVGDGDVGMDEETATVESGVGMISMDVGNGKEGVREVEEPLRPHKEEQG